MRKVFKWIGIVLGGLVGLLFLVVIGLTIYGNAKFKPTLKDRPLYPIEADMSSEGLRRGKYLVEDTMSCDEACHSPEGRPFTGVFENINMGPISGVFATPNLTPDKETGLGNWSDAEIARAIREGVDKDGVALVVMPAYNYNALSDADVAAVIGYLRSLGPVHNEIPPLSLNFAGKILLALGVFGENPVREPITTARATPQMGTIEYGKYMVALGACSDCHQANLAGGKPPFAPPEQPMAANLTPAGELAGWSEADFIAAVQAGKHPSGRMLSDGMPRYGMNEQDLAAIFKYLQTISPVEAKK